MADTGMHIAVTGGTGALGTAVTQRLIAAGATCHIPNVVAEELARFPLKDHAQVRVVEGVELTDQAAVDRFYDALPPLWGSVHTAGGFAMSKIAETSGADFVAQFRMNALTCFLCCRAAVRSIRGRSGGGLPAGGRIVNVAARPALEARQGAGMIPYTAAKSAVAALTEALAEELADEQIWVNAVAPSILDTPANRQAMPKAPHDKWPKLADVAGVMAFLALPENAVGRGGIVPVYGRM